MPLDAIERIVKFSIFFYSVNTRLGLLDRFLEECVGLAADFET